MAEQKYVGAIEGFKAQIRTIQRASLFDVTIPNFHYAPATNGKSMMLKFGVKAAVFPASTVGDVVVNYMGRQIHWYGDRSYGGQWATTCILDGRWELFNVLYAWNQGLGGSNRIVSHDINKHNNFKHDAYVTAYSTDGQVAHRIVLKGLWPQDLQDINMDWTQTDAAIDLGITWVYDYVLTDSVQPTENGPLNNVAIPTLEGRSAAGNIGASSGSQGNTQTYSLSGPTS